MHIKRLLDDKEVFAGSKVFDAQGRSYAFVEHANGQLVAVSPDGKKVKSSPVEFGCYLLSRDRTDLGLAKDRLRSFWEDS